MTLGDFGHRRHGLAGIGEAYVVSQSQQASDRRLLMNLVEVRERTRQMSACAGDGGSTGAVVPIRGGVKIALFAESDEQLFDQEPVIEDKSDRGTRHLLVGKFGVGDVSDRIVVPHLKNVAELSAGLFDTTGHDQRGIAEVDDPDLAAVIDAPPMTQFCRQARLASMGHSGRYGRSHGCIVRQSLPQSGGSTTSGG